MKSRNIPLILILSFLGLLFQLLACVAGVVPALAWGLLWPISLQSLASYFGVSFARVWLGAAVPAFATLAGVAVAFFGQAHSFRASMWLAPVLGAAASGIWLAVRKSRDFRCSLCDSRIGSNVAFTCPRCDLLVCERKCWNFDHCRCVLCEQNRVPVLPIDGRWWDKRLGPRAAFGRCQSCQASAAEADLRACGRCGRAHCRECWDYLNGQCSRCAWAIDDLPESLKAFLLAP